LASRVIDQLITSASFEAKQKFMDAFAEDLRAVAMDPYGSHVLQKLVLSTAFGDKVYLTLSYLKNLLLKQFS
jgi:hypothetical protein